mgnify:CR=1 FL=1
MSSSKLQQKKPSRRGKRPSNDASSRRNGVASERLIAAKNRRLKKLLQSWLDDESGYDEETWPWLKKALEEDRLSSRRLFRE